MNISKKARWFLAALVLLLSLAAAAQSLYASIHSLQTSYYTVSSQKLLHPLRVALLTDLHNNTFGTDNQLLLASVQASDPDLILLVGDMLNASQRDTGLVTDLIGQLSQIAPVYCSYGNHEQEHEASWGSDLSAVFEQAGATMLESDYVDLEINGQPLRLGGIFGFCLAEKYLVTGEARQDECDFLHQLQNTDRYTMLMCHMPVAWMINHGLDEWDVDCVFSGHAHGGQIRIPLLGGLYAPDMGWFPGQMQGTYHSTDGTNTLVLSRGLGTNPERPRFNNIPELVIVDLLPQT